MTAEQIDKLLDEGVSEIEALDADNAEEIRFLRNTLQRDLQSDYELPWLFDVNSNEIGALTDTPEAEWELLSLQCRDRVGWKCEECGIDLNTDRYNLHAHRIRGTQHNNFGDLMALCTGCYAEQPRHRHLKNQPDYQKFMDLYRDRWETSIEAKLASERQRPFDYESEEWRLLSLQCRDRVGWKCEECGIDLNTDRYNLHAHHIRGTQHNNLGHLMALCTGEH